MEKQINLMDLIKLYMRRWWVLVIGLVIGGIVAGTYTALFVTRMYESAGSLYTENTNDYLSQEVTDVNLNTIMVRKELVGTYAEVLTSNTFLKKVAEESGLGYTHTELLSMLSMTSKNETEILVIIVKSPYPQHAYIIAQTIMNLAEEQISTVVEGGSVKILDEPEFPTTYSSPNIVNNTQIGMLIGLLISLIIVFVIEMLDNKVKDANQISEQFKYPILGEIPYFAANNKKTANAKALGKTQDASVDVASKEGK